MPLLFLLQKQKKNKIGLFNIRMPSIVKQGNGNEKSKHVLQITRTFSTVVRN